MADKRSADFAAMVWDFAKRLGMSPKKITDEIMSAAFPNTFEAAEAEGAAAMFRAGVGDEVKRVLRKTASDESQHDFASIDPSFHHLVKPLQSKAYFVEAVGEHVPVAMLIVDPALLDDARRHMRRKGEETLAEAERLDVLYREGVAVAETAA